MRKQCKSSGFTLIELLVVITIIGILAAILFPVFSAAREKARSASCASNLKQLGLAALQYVQDYDEAPMCGRHYLPNSQCGALSTGAYGWAGQLYPYVQSAALYSCPDDRYSDQNEVVYNGGAATGPRVAYAYNPNLVYGTFCQGWNSTAGLNTSKLNSSAVTVLFSEISIQRWWPNWGAQDVQTGESLAYGNSGLLSAASNGYDGNNWQGSNGGFYNEAGPLGCRADEPGDQGGGGGKPKDYPFGRHNGGSNFAFWDGHVKWLNGTLVSSGENARTPYWNANMTANPTGAADCSGGSGVAAGTQGTMNGNGVVATFSVF